MQPSIQPTLQYMRYGHDSALYFSQENSAQIYNHVHNEWVMGWASPTKWHGINKQNASFPGYYQTSLLQKFFMVQQVSVFVDPWMIFNYFLNNFLIIHRKCDWLIDFGLFGIIMQELKLEWTETLVIMEMTLPLMMRAFRYTASLNWRLAFTLPDW